MIFDRMIGGGLLILITGGRRRKRLLGFVFPARMAGLWGCVDFCILEKIFCFDYDEYPAPFAVGGAVHAEESAARHHFSSVDSFDPGFKLDYLAQGKHLDKTDGNFGCHYGQV